MQRKFKYKVKNGKLLEIRIEFDDSIKSIKILGDFFIYPSDGLEKIEDALIGLTLDKDTIENAVKNIMHKQKIESIGIDPESIAFAIIEASK